MKAEELVPAVEAVLAESGGGGDGEERARIEQALTRVKDLLEGGGAAQLKAAVEALDGATEALAARMVEEALMAQMQRKLGQEG